MRAVHIGGIAVLLGGALLAAGATSLNADERQTLLRAPLCVVVGRPTVLSFPAVRQARVVAGGERLRAVRLSNTSVQLTAVCPGGGYLAIETPAGREIYAVSADAAPEACHGRGDRSRWLSATWHRVRQWVARAAAASPLSRLAPGRPALQVDIRGHSLAPALAPAPSRKVLQPTLAAISSDAPPACGPGRPCVTTPAAPRMFSLLAARARMPVVASSYRLSTPPAAPAPRVDPGAPRPGTRVAPSLVAMTPQPVACAERPAPPIARFPTAAAGNAPRRPTGSADGEERIISLLTGTQPVQAAVKTIPGLPQPPDEAPDQPLRITLGEGKSRILPCRSVRTVQIDDPTGAIAEVQPVSDTEILVLAKGAGSTMLRIWDARGRTEYELTVEPGPARRQQLIQEAINLKGITARVVDTTCILDGEVENVEQIARAQRIAEAFVTKVVNLLRLPAPPPVTPPPPEPDLAALVQAVLPRGEVTAEALPGQPTTVVLRGKVPRVEDIEALTEVANKVVSAAKGTVVNLVQLAQPRQVRVQARMLSVDEGALRDLGIRWLDPSLTGPVLFGQNEPRGDFRLLTSIQGNIKTLMEDSRAELLSAPSTVVNSGATGYIMVGGEIPIPQMANLAVGEGTSVGTTVTFRPFGVLLSIEPVVEPGDDITLRLLVEVSSIDRNNSVVVNGSPIPGFATKRALNELRLKAGETLVIGGLISREDAKTVAKFPILADIPVFGSFFRSVHREKQARELVLFLTPELLPGPEPPMGLRQLPALKPDTSGRAGPFSLGIGITQSIGGTGTGTGTGTGGGTGGRGGAVGGTP